MPDTIGKRLALFGASAAERGHRSVRRFTREPGIVRTSVSTGDRSTRLVMSEWFVIAALALSLVWSRSEEAFPGAIVRIVGHLSAPILLGGACLSLLGHRMFAALEKTASPPVTPLGLTWPLLLLASMILGGSTYAQLAGGATETFRNMGAYMLAAYLIARVVVTSRNPVRLVTVFFLLLAIVGGMSLMVMTALFFTSKLIPFHELEFLIIPLIIYIATRRVELSTAEIVLVWCGISSSILFRKNTGYLVALGVLVYLWLFQWRVPAPRANSLKRVLKTYVGAVLVGIFITGYYATRHLKEGYLPTGNAEFRLHMYELAWNRFLESPVWGTLFSAPAVQKFTLYNTGVANNLLPTHSDTLDLLSHGGVVAIGLWLTAHWLLVRAVWTHILSRRAELNPHVVALAHTMLCMTLLGAVTYSFNPLLLNPGRAMVIWGQFGLLAGLACHCATIGQFSPKTQGGGAA